MKTTFQVLMVSAIASLANAYGYYAEFCDDANCSVNCGEAVRINNPGCLNESGRGSIGFHGSVSIEEGHVFLISSPSPNCPCQDNCTVVASSTPGIGVSVTTINSGCIPAPEGESFRFVSGNVCPGNNC